VRRCRDRCFDVHDRDRAVGIHVQSAQGVDDAIYGLAGEIGQDEVTDRVLRCASEHGERGQS